MYAARILIRAEVVACVADGQRLFQFREQEKAANRRLGGSRKQPVVAASIEPENGGTSRTTQAVGFQPFQRSCLLEIGDGAGIEGDQAHFVSHVLCHTESLFSAARLNRYLPLRERAGRRLPEDKGFSWL